MAKFTLLKSVVATSLILAASSLYAAKVPAGVQLAEKQHLIFDGSSEPETLDPQRMTGSVEGDIARQLFEGLVNTDAEGNIQPGVAISWEHSADYKQWTFKLRPEAKWSNGDPVTAHDFVYAWQRLVNPKNAFQYADYLSLLKVENVNEILTGKKAVEELGVKAIDDHTFQVTLAESIPYAVDLMSMYVLFPTHKATVEKHGDTWTQPANIVHNGAYGLGKRVINEKIELKRNKTYWNDKETVIDTVDLIIGKPEKAVSLYRANQIHFSAVPAVLFKKMKEEYPNEIYVNAKLSNSTFQMNLKRDVFKDVRVRKALDLAVDRKIITENVLGRGEKITYTFTPKQIAGGELIKDPEYASWTQEQRNAEAKKLLTEAGYSKDKPLTFEILYVTSETLKNIVVAIDSMWKKAFDGAVKISLKNQEWKTYLQTTGDGHFDMAWKSWGADYNEATTYLTYFLTGGNFNSIGFSNAEYDALIKSSYTLASDKERQEVYAKAEALLDSQHPFISTYVPVGVFLKKPFVKGYEGKDPQSQYRFKDWWIEKH